MPLYKRKPFTLLEMPKELELQEPVYQVRFTKEIFCHYQDYLNRINFYRQRLWTCKITGKSNLTFEEALVSEKRASEKVQQFPQELVAPALRIVQFSMLSLKDLADMIAAKLQDFLFVGVELYGRNADGVFPCRIVKIQNHDPSKIQYEIRWLDKYKEPTGNAVVNEDELIKKKLPISRSMLKSFIRESTCRSAPWVLHDELAEKHGISRNIPEELKSKFCFDSGVLVNLRKRVSSAHERKDSTEEQGVSLTYKRRKKVSGVKLEDLGKEGKNDKGVDQTALEVIKYPIEDLLVKPGVDDRELSNRPSPSRDFKVPLDCVGDLLMVWDFCSSFGRLLHLSPFSLEDFENAVCHRESNLILIVEAHSTLLRLLIKYGREYSSFVQGRNRKSKVTLITWTEYLCDFLDMSNTDGLRSHIATIKRGHYGLIDVRAKLEILRLLVNDALETDLVRNLLDEYIEQWHELGATRRGEALQEAKKRREDKALLKAHSDFNGTLESNNSNVIQDPLDNNHGKQSEGKPLNKSNNVSKKSIANGGCTSKSWLQKGNAGDRDGSRHYPSKKGSHEVVLSTDERKASMSSKEQRKQFYEREMEKRFIRTNALGKDRHYNRYWWFRRDGRIFIESSDFKLWGYYSTKEELDLLIGSLNCKGEREKALHGKLKEYYTRICMELQKRSKDLADKIAEEEAVVRRSTRVRAPPRDNPANAYLRYVNKWKED